MSDPGQKITGTKIAMGVFFGLFLFFIVLPTAVCTCGGMLFTGAAKTLIPRVKTIEKKHGDPCQQSSDCEGNLFCNQNSVCADL